jgi:hypothetical protein
MTSWGDKIEQGVDSIIAETWVTLDARFLCKNIVVLSLEVADDLAETAETIVN